MKENNVVAIVNVNSSVNVDILPAGLMLSASFSKLRYCVVLSAKNDMLLWS